MALILHATKDDKNAMKVLIAAEYSGVKVELAKGFKMGVSNRTHEFRRMNPFGKIPMLETSDGVLYESNAIARYVTRLVPNNPLMGSSLMNKGLIDQWIDFVTMDVDANLMLWLNPRLGYAAFIPQVEKAAISSLRRALSTLNIVLANYKYVAGLSITLADIVLTCDLVLGFREIFTESFTSEFPHIESYFWTTIKLPFFSQIIGKVKQAKVVPPIKAKVVVSEKKVRKGGKKCSIWIRNKLQKLMKIITKVKPNESVRPAGYPDQKEPLSPTLNHSKLYTYKLKTIPSHEILSKQFLISTGFTYNEQRSLIWNNLMYTYGFDGNQYIMLMEAVNEDWVRKHNS